MAPEQSHGFVGDDVPPQSALDRCVRCGLCLPACPTYLETSLETSSPRGRIALIAAVADNRLPVDADGFVHQMYECLGCGACATACPSGVDYAALLMGARAQVERAAPLGATVSPILRSVIRGRLFERPKLFRALARGYAWFGGLLSRELRAYVPRLSDRFFVPRGQRARSATLERGATVFFHAGCVAQVACAEACTASVRVLQRAGCEVTTPGDQTCCGAWAVAAGEPQRARALARRNIAAFERSGADVLVTDSAGCGAALKGYGALLAADGEWSARAGAFATRVRDTTEWLDDAGIGSELGAIDLRIVYVDPCRLANQQRVSGAALRLLRRIPGLSVRVPSEAAVCCGGPGAYPLREPEMSRRLAARKLERVLASEPNAVVTADPECALQLATELRRLGRVLPVRSVVELLDDAYGAYKPASGPSAANAESTLS